MAIVQFSAKYLQCNLFWVGFFYDFFFYYCYYFVKIKTSLALSATALIKCRSVELFIVLLGGLDEEDNVNGVLINSDKNEKI